MRATDSSPPLKPRVRQSGAEPRRRETIVGLRPSGRGPWRSPGRAVTRSPGRSRSIWDWCRHGISCGWRAAVASCPLVLLSGSVTAWASDGPIPMPAPRYEVRVDSSVWIAMRDGTRLAADMYFPVTPKTPLPVILMRTPYDKHRLKDAAMFWAGQGFATVVEDVRGRFESDGQYTYWSHDREDGYDTVEWLASQTWSNGKVGTIGCSYGGETQISMAATRPPHLAAMIPQSAGSSLGAAGGGYRYMGAFFGGAVELAASTEWFRLAGSKMFYRPPAETPHNMRVRVGKYFSFAPKVPDADMAKLVWTLPIIDILAKADAPPSDYEKIISTPLTDSWWDQFGYISDRDRFDVPALHIDSWYDHVAAESLYLFNLFRTNAVSARARDNQFVIMSPATHCRSEQMTGAFSVGERPMGDPRLDYWAIYLRWFDHWLRGADNGITSMPKVQYYTMGRNTWQAAGEWPPSGMRLSKMYLHSSGRANSRYGSGTLSASLPGDEPPDVYTFDPATPVPSNGGADFGSAGSFDQSTVEMRDDVLVYSTAPLSKRVEVTGPVELVLHVSSDERDTDFTGRLVDVYPDGRAFNVTEGILRARYRAGFNKLVWMKRGEVYELRIRLGVTSNEFDPGHRIRLEVSSSSFPRWDRNLNTGGKNYDETKWLVAQNTVHHSRAWPSYLILPVIQ
jgi:putative CocE/NonD family hydrolase